MKLKKGSSIIQFIALALAILSSFLIYNIYRNNNLTKSLCNLNPGFGLISLLIMLFSSIIIFILAMLIEGDVRHYFNGMLYDPSLMVQNILIVTLILFLTSIRNFVNNYTRILCAYNDILYLLVLFLLVVIIKLYKDYGRLR